MTAPRELASRLNDIAQGLLGGDKRTLKEAAVRIEALEAENARLRGALKRIADLVDTDVGDPLDDAIEFARAALGSEKK